MFDYPMQGRTIEALSKLHARNIPVTEDSLRNELAFGYCE